MGPKETSFTSDECQCLLDILDRCASDNWSRIEGKTVSMFLKTEEDKAVYERLKKAGEFYVPDKTDKQKLDETILVESMKVLEMNPGDILVFKSPHSFSEKQLATFMDMVKRAIERLEIQNVHAILLEDGMDMGVIRKRTYITDRRSEQ